MNNEILDTAGWLRTILSSLLYFHCHCFVYILLAWVSVYPCVQTDEIPSLCAVLYCVLRFILFIFYYCQLKITQNSMLLLVLLFVCGMAEVLSIIRNNTFFLFVCFSFSLSSRLFTSLLSWMWVRVYEANTLNNQFIVCDMREMCACAFEFVCKSKSFVCDTHSSSDHYEEIYYWCRHTCIIWWRFP